METERLIKEEFKKFVESTFQKDDIRSFLLNHPKVPLLIGNLTREIRKCDIIILGSKRDLEDKRKTVIEVARDFSKMFCKYALEEKEKELANG